EQLYCCRRGADSELGDGVLGWIPFRAARQHGVEDADQLAHEGDEGDLGFLALGDEALVASLEHRIVLGRCAQNWHEQELSQLVPSSLDVAWTMALTAVSVEGSHSEQGRSGLAIDEAELWQEGDEACRGSPGQAWHALDDLGALGEALGLVDLGGNDGFQLGQLKGHGLEQRLLGLLHGLGLLMLAPAFDLLLQPHDAQPRRDYLVEFLALFVMRLSGCLAEHRAEPGDHARIDRI